ncbi:exoribonuclease R [Encephalitozoon intestinalis ATCC 50506]|uniref:Ribosomal RNA-processing protein 44 n=1 Tax=Encephalitozoon intestinalis (strain ATCC 50506) TaxID=876142 RepID=E0S670_ENCIT|nr:exoribonuclease R [Encephalitozoon intestinalis ATCC 50506]ADM11205.1 exoribonuclease R [Encephalitozoon intestinalis ATCC 50506]UTX44872.1 exoribonuclease R [Encephalitozoon intestinalis]
MWYGIVAERKISKRLKLIKRVREHYVRDDVPCGFECCGGMCKENKRTSVFVIPDAAVMSKYRALLKSDYVAAIICQSALEELSRNDEKGLRDVAREKGYAVFCNNFCKSTSGRGLEGVLEFYKDHLPQYKFIILTMDNIWEYGKYVSDDIQDLLSIVDEKEATEYEDYRENLDVQYGKKGLYRGMLEVSMYNCYSGFVVDGDVKILVIGKKNMNRAINGDEVYVEEIDECDEDGILVDDEEGLKETRKRKEDKEMFGKVVGIYRRKCRAIVGTISPRTVHGIGTQNVLVIPIDKRIPAVRIRTGQAEELMNKRLCVEIDGWEKTSNYPSGHYYRRLGTIGDKDAEVEAILVANGITYYNSSWKDILGDSWESEERFGIERIYREIEEGSREDFRDLATVSIDPPGCEDIDDALHCRLLPNGNWEIGVHIADVAYYVRKDSKMDKVARDRSTTVYLPERRIDMLPPSLSTDLCSLVAGKDRAAFSVVWEMSNDAKIVRTHFSRSLIRSRRSFSYQEAYDVIRGFSAAEEEILSSLATLLRMSKILRNGRLEKGSLDLSTRQLTFRGGKLEVKECLPTNFLVEEFMILANISVASFIYHHHPDSSLLRKHPPPSVLDDNLGIDASSESVGNLLNKVEGLKKDLMKRMLIRSMNQAVYVVSGETSNFHHYGLATPMYTHFTSPIRRYADIIVHRILGHILQTAHPEEIHTSKLGIVTFLPRKNTEKETQSQKFADEDMCRNMNSRYRSAKKASWECGKVIIYTMLKDRESLVEGFITNIKANGVVVYVPEYNLEEVVVSEGHFQMFQKVQVKILRDDERFFLRRRFTFEISNLDSQL